MDHGYWSPVDHSSCTFFFRTGPTATPLTQPTEGRRRVSYGTIRETIDAI